MRGNLVALPTPVTSVKPVTSADSVTSPTQEARASSVVDAAGKVTARTWWILAGFAAAVSLGLGWDWYYHPYYGTQILFAPGSSVLLADGTVSYTPGSLLLFPSFDYASGAIPGYASHARVLLPIAVLMFLQARRHGSPRLARFGLAVAGLAPLLAGGLTQGSAIFLIGLGCAAMALRGNRLLELPRSR